MPDGGGGERTKALQTNCKTLVKNFQAHTASFACKLCRK